MTDHWGETILTFNEVSFEFGHNKPILTEVDFTVRKGAKLTLMGQNGAGKSTIFKLITGEFKPEAGTIIKNKNLTIAVSRQVIPREDMTLTMREFFQKCFTEKVYDIDPRIDAVLAVVNLDAPHDRIVKSFSGGQQARLLLASALIQDPDVLLLDEPTNNLDTEGINHLIAFLQDYKKTCMIISHDAHFLNSFTEGVVYLDARTKKIEQYVGNYSNVVSEIAARVEKEQRKNAQLEKEIQANKDKANFFANKGGRLRLVAKRMREKAEDAEENMVDVRKEDKPIRKFIIPVQEDLTGILIELSSVSIIRDHKPTEKKVNVTLKKNQHLLLKGPNGIGKTTLLERLASGHAKGEKIQEGVRIGYYRQDFSTLDFDRTPMEELFSVMKVKDEHKMRGVAASFLIDGTLMRTPIGRLSEGQKGLVAFAQLVLLEPGILILDEPTNHINFRHLPIIAKALHDFEGAMILVSHVDDFVAQVRIDETLDLGGK